MQLIKPFSSISFKLQMLLQFVFINLKREKEKKMPSNKNIIFFFFSIRSISPILKFFSNMKAPRNYMFTSLQIVWITKTNFLCIPQIAVLIILRPVTIILILFLKSIKLISDTLLSKTFFFCLSDQERQNSDHNS